MMSKVKKRSSPLIVDCLFIINLLYKINGLDLCKLKAHKIKNCNNIQ